MKWFKDADVKSLISEDFCLLTQPDITIVKKIEDLGSEEEVKKMNDFLSDCQEVFKNLENLEYAEVSWINFVFVGIILLFFVFIAIITIGVTRFVEAAFYCISFHWLLKQIISFRESDKETRTLAYNLRRIMENDDELANAIIEAEDEEDSGEDDEE